MSWKKTHDGGYVLKIGDPNGQYVKLSVGRVVDLGLSGSARYLRRWTAHTVRPISPVEKQEYLVHRGYAKTLEEAKAAALACVRISFESYPNSTKGGV